MAQFITNKPHYLVQFHDWLIHKFGGEGNQYAVQGGGLKGPDFLQIDTDALDQQTLETVVTAHNSLGVTIDKTTLNADGTDTATITCADALIAGDANLDYVVWVDNAIYTERSSAPVVNGQVELALTTEVAGEYLVELSRQGVTAYATGYVTITVEEV